MEQENDIILYGISGAGEERPNIADLLKDCPKGTKLYSPICGECEFEEIDSVVGYIIVHGPNEATLSFDNNGKNLPKGECLLFPSEKVRDWNLFRVLYVRMTGIKKQDDKLKVLLFIDHPILMQKEFLPDTILYRGRIDNEVYENRKDDEEYNYVLSTGVELKLKEEEQPKFKVGDVVKINGFIHILAEDNTQFPPCKYPDHRYSEYGIGACMNCANDNDTRLATPEEIDKWNEDVLQPNHLHYSKSKRKIIRWFLPFDKIAGRDDEGWYCDLFSHYKSGTNEEYPYCGMGGADYHICLPYNEETARLIGTTDDYEEE